MSPARSASAGAGDNAPIGLRIALGALIATASIAMKQPKA